MKRILIVVLMLTGMISCDAPQKEIPVGETDSQPVEVKIPTDTTPEPLKVEFVVLRDLSSQIQEEIRYYGNDNFTGRRVKGYLQPVAILTREAAEALVAVNNNLMQNGLRLKVFDAYRPARAVRSFCQWARVEDDTLTKRSYYPEVEKKDLFRLNYLSSKSTHSRGSTVDLTLVDMETGEEVDMGSHFDFLGDISHFSYAEITPEQRRNRTLLREAMMQGGFSPIESEWWHFRLRNEPTKEMFDFPVHRDSIPNKEF